MILFFFLFLFFLIRNSSRLITLPYSKVKYNGVSCPSIIPRILKYGNMEKKRLQSKPGWLLFTEPSLASCCYDWLTHLGRCSSVLEDIGWWVFTLLLLAFCKLGQLSQNIFFLCYHAPFFQNAHTVLLSCSLSHTSHMVRFLWCVCSVFWFMCFFSEFSTCCFEIKYLKKNV